MPNNVSGAIAYPLLNSIVEVGEWVITYIPHFTLLIHLSQRNLPMAVFFSGVVRVNMMLLEWFSDYVYSTFEKTLL